VETAFPQVRLEKRTQGALREERHHVGLQADRVVERANPALSGKQRVQAEGAAVPRLRESGERLGGVGAGAGDQLEQRGQEALGGVEVDGGPRFRQQGYAALPARPALLRCPRERLDGRVALGPELDDGAVQAEARGQGGASAQEVLPGFPDVDTRHRGHAAADARDTRGAGRPLATSHDEDSARIRSAPTSA
jgi:hypothetical protein